MHHSFPSGFKLCRRFLLSHTRLMDFHLLPASYVALVCSNSSIGKGSPHNL